MKILAIETSCDETGIVIVEGFARDPDAGGMHLEFKIIKNALLSQAALHAPYGGVYPNLAKREHEKNLPVLFEEILKATPSKDKESPLFDAIAVTQGPGLEPALWQGIEFAKKVAAERGLPLLPVNHMEGHLISSLAQRQGDTLNQGSQGVTFVLQNIKLPVLALLISGGHTEFVLMKEWFAYEIIGETLDDAVGECFDKVARMLCLPYPGGPEISKLAKSARENEAKQVEASISQRDGARIANFQQKIMRARRDFVSRNIILPRPMLHTNNCDVSFSGLKTAALYALRDATKVRPLSEEERVVFAREFEDAVTEVFLAKTKRALQETGAKTFVIGGGVAANTHIRTQLEKLLKEEFSDIEIRLPELSITGDNAVMIAQAALAHVLAGDWDLSRRNLDIRAIGNLSITTDLKMLE